MNSFKQVYVFLPGKLFFPGIIRIFFFTWKIEKFSNSENSYNWNQDKIVVQLREKLGYQE